MRNFKISETVGDSAKFHSTTLYIMIFVIEWKHCVYCTLYSLPTFWRSTIWKVNISKTVRTSTKNASHDFYTFWYFPSMASLRKLYNVLLTCFLQLKKFKRYYLGQCELAYLPSLVRHPPSSCSCFIQWWDVWLTIMNCLKLVIRRALASFTCAFVSERKYIIVYLFYIYTYLLFIYLVNFI